MAEDTNDKAKGFEVEELSDESLDSVAGGGFDAEAKSTDCSAGESRSPEWPESGFHSGFPWIGFELVTKAR
jgi:hypothetical protein